MAAAVDASSPVRWSGTVSQSGSTTSASFTAPAGAILVLTVQSDGNSASISCNVSDSTGMLWTLLVARTWTETTSGGASHIFYARTLASQSRTVTVSRSDGDAGTYRFSCKLYAVTGATDVTQLFDTVGANNEGGSGTNNLTTSAITAGDNGLLIVSDCDWNQRGTFTSSDLTIDTADYAGAISVCSGYKTVSSGASVTANLNAGGSAAAQHKWCQVIIREAPAAPAAARAARWRKPFVPDLGDPAERSNLPPGCLFWLLPLPNRYGGQSVADVIGGNHLTVDGTWKDDVGIYMASGAGAEMSGVPAVLQPSYVTFIWYGIVYGAGGPSNPSLGGCYWDSAGTAPYNSYGIDLNSGGLSTPYFAIGYGAGSQTYVRPTSIPGGVPTVLGLTYDGTTLRAYVDGVDSANGPISSTLAYGGTPYFSFGKYLSRNADARLLSSMVFNRALSADEMARLTREHFAGFPNYRKTLKARYSHSSLSSVFSATAALSVGRATLSSTSTFSPGTKTASSTLVTRAATSSSSATRTTPTYTASSTLAVRAVTESSVSTFVPPSYIASSAVVIGGSTVTSSAVFTPPTYTASASLTYPEAVSSAAATFVPPSYTASSSLTSGAATSSSSSSFTAPSYTASSSLISPATSNSSAATFVPPTYSATSALVAQPPSLSSSATFATQTYTASSPLVVGETSVATAASFTPPTYTASSSLVTGGSTLSSSASSVTPTYTASSALTAASPSMSSSASFASEVFLATVAVTVGVTAMSSSATFTAPSYSGAASLVSPKAAASSSSTFTPPTYQASSSLTVGGVVVTSSSSFVGPMFTSSAVLVIGDTVVSSSVTFTPPSRTATASLSTGGASASASADVENGVFTASVSLVIGEILLASSASVNIIIGPFLSEASGVWFAGMSDRSGTWSAGSSEQQAAGPGVENSDVRGHS